MVGGTSVSVPPLLGNAIKLSPIGDDCCGFKVHRFEGSKVLSRAHSILTLSEYVRDLRTFSNLFSRTSPSGEVPKAEGAALAVKSKMLDETKAVEIEPMNLRTYEPFATCNMQTK